ncbi:MAG: hypothetical protein ACXVPF_13810 [Bacteroidia bacterium]
MQSGQNNIAKYNLIMPLYKIKLLAFLCLFSALSFAQNTDSTSVAPPPATAPANTETYTPSTPPSSAEPNNSYQQEPNRKYPKGFTNYKNGGKPKEETPFQDKLYYGCNIALRAYSSGGASVFYYDLSPHVGYKFNEYLSSGAQIIYNNFVLTQGASHANYNIIGGGVFARFVFAKAFFLQAEYDILTVPDNFMVTSGTHRTETDEKMFGLGYKSGWGSKLSYFIVLMYDFQPSFYSPYYGNPLVYRAGLVWNF